MEWVVVRRRLTVVASAMLLLALAGGMSVSLIHRHYLLYAFLAIAFLGIPRIRRAALGPIQIAGDPFAASIVDYLRLRGGALIVIAVALAVARFEFVHLGERANAREFVSLTALTGIALVGTEIVSQRWWPQRWLSYAAATLGLWAAASGLIGLHRVGPLWKITAFLISITAVVGAVGRGDPRAVAVRAAAVCMVAMFVSLWLLQRLASGELVQAVVLTAVWILGLVIVFGLLIRRYETDDS